MFRCQHCDEVLGQRANLRRHIKECHPKDWPRSVKKKRCDTDNIHSSNGKFICEHCNKEYSQKRNLSRHIKNCHAEEHSILMKEEICSTFVCNICNRLYTQHRNLRRHIKKVHESVSIPSLKEDPDRWFLCEYCFKKYRTKAILRAHHLKEHGDFVEKKRRGEVVLKENDCPLRCGFNSSMKQELVSHFKTDHHIEIVTQCLTFPDYPSFLSWKQVTERETDSKYIVPSGKVHSKSKTRSYFSCHRSGKFVSASKGLRMPRQIGSKKIDGFCPASIEVKQDKSTGECKVTYLKTHVGHNCDKCQPSNNIHTLVDAELFGRKGSSIQNECDLKSIQLSASIQNEYNSKSVDLGVSIQNECDLKSIDLGVDIQNEVEQNVCSFSLDSQTNCESGEHRITLSLEAIQKSIENESVIGEGEYLSLETRPSGQNEDIQSISMSLEARKERLMNSVKEMICTTQSIAEITVIEEILSEIAPAVFAVRSSNAVLKSMSNR